MLKARVQKEAGQLAEAVKSYRGTAADFQRAGNQATEGLTLASIGEMHSQMGDNASSIEAFDQALAIGEKLLKNASTQERSVILPSRATILDKKAESHKRLEQWAQAIESYYWAATDLQVVKDQASAGVAL